MLQRLAGQGAALLRACSVAGCLAASAPSAFAQEDDVNTRGVRILDDAPSRPSLDAGPAAAGAALPNAGPAVPPPPVIELGKLDPKADNPAGVSIEILPASEFQVGSRIAFRIAAKRPGYLILVDVDPSGKLTQIYPNRGSLLATGGRQGSNLIKPGRVMTIPDRNNPWAGFEFLAAPPSGIAMVVAILSERPVQLMDLPDVPPQFAGREAALAYLARVARDLRIPPADGSGDLQETKWSFDAKFYAIR